MQLQSDVQVYGLKFKVDNMKREYRVLVKFALAVLQVKNSEGQWETIRNVTGLAETVAKEYNCPMIVER